MPASIKPNIPLRAGGPAPKRAAGYTPICRNGGKGGDKPTRNAHFLASVKFKPLQALEVADRQESIQIPIPVTGLAGGGLSSFYEKVSILLHKAGAILGLVPFSPKASARKDVGFRKHFASLKKQLPKDIAFSIGYDQSKGAKGGYYLLLWVECEWNFNLYGAQLHFAWAYLQGDRRKEAARELLARALAHLQNKTGVLFWFQLQGAFLTEMLIDQVSDLMNSRPDEFGGEPDDLHDWELDVAAGTATVTEYTTGEAYLAEEEITRWLRGDSITTEELQSMAEGFPEFPFLQEAVIGICKKASTGCSIDAFDNSDHVDGLTCYDEDDELGPREGATLRDTVAIMWNEDDALTQIHIEMTEAISHHSGTVGPTAILRIDNSTTAVDLPQFLSRQNWPFEMQSFLTCLNDTLSEPGPAPENP